MLGDGRDTEVGQILTVTADGEKRREDSSPVIWEERALEVAPALGFLWSSDTWGTVPAFFPNNPVFHCF